MSILEVGCGLGYVVDLIARNNQNIRVSGSDISKKAIKIAKKKFPQYNFFVDDITTTIEATEQDTLLKLPAAIDALAQGIREDLECNI